MGWDDMGPGRDDTAPYSVISTSGRDLMAGWYKIPPSGRDDMGLGRDDINRVGMAWVRSG